MEALVSIAVFVVGVMFICLYVYSYRRLMNLLKARFPERWQGLEEGEITADSDIRETKKMLHFLESSDDLKDPELTRLKSVARLSVILGGICIGALVAYWFARLIVFPQF